VLIISACLAGVRCRYSGDAAGHDPELKRLAESGRALLLCPEVLGGAPVPREPCEIKGGDGFDVLAGRARVYTKHGADKTDVFLAGAASVLDAARRCGAKTAILKERSPSCGSASIYDGTFSGRQRPGCGCTAAILLRAGLTVCSEENYRLLVRPCACWYS